MRSDVVRAVAVGAVRGDGVAALARHAVHGARRTRPTAFSWHVPQLTGFSFSACGIFCADTSAWQSVHFNCISPCTDFLNRSASTAMDLPPDDLASLSAWHMKHVSFGAGAGAAAGAAAASAGHAARTRNERNAHALRIDRTGVIGQPCLRGEEGPSAAGCARRAADVRKDAQMLTCAPPGGVDVDQPVPNEENPGSRAAPDRSQQRAENSATSRQSGRRATSSQRRLRCDARHASMNAIVCAPSSMRG